MRSLSRLVAAAIVRLTLASCSTSGAIGRIAAPVSGQASTTAPRSARYPAAALRTAAPASTGPGRRSPLPAPVAMRPFGRPAVTGEGAWSPAGRPGGGVRAVYETTLVPPGGTQPAGIAWMDTGLLSARLYSGSESPGGGAYRYTAPVTATQAEAAAG